MVGIKRFKEAQLIDYDKALQEIKNGHKESHWIWYIFPQLVDLGMSNKSIYYGIRGIKEAKKYYKDKYLRHNLLEICDALYNINNKTITDIFEWDDIKVQSSMTLFYIVSKNVLFKNIIDKYFDGEFDTNTIELLGSD